MAELQEITARVVASYASRSVNAKLYCIHDEARKIDLVVVVPLKPGIAPHIMVMTRIEDNRVVIEVDATDSPLEEVLHTAGVSGSQIIFAK